MLLYSPDWTNTGFSFILLTVNLFRHSTLKPLSHCAGVATVHSDAGQPVYRDAPGHIS